MIILSELDRNDLETIYELTYKYGMLISEEKTNDGWLPDKAYMVKSKIEGDLNSLLDVGMEELINTYNEWLGYHNKEGWIESQLENFSFSEFLEYLDKSNIYYDEDMIYDSVVESLGGDRRMLENDDIEFWIESYGEAFIKDYDRNVSGEEEKKLYEAIDEYGDDPEELIENLNLEGELIDYILASGWTGKDWLKDIYQVNDLVEQYPNAYRKFMGHAYNQWLEHFGFGTGTEGASLSEHIEDIQEMQSELVNISTDTSIKDKIILFQKGLNTAHHFGIMADHLLGVSGGDGQEILDELSSGTMIEEWNTDLTELLGYVPGSKIKTEEEWFSHEDDPVLLGTKKLAFYLCGFLLSQYAKS